MAQSIIPLWKVRLALNAARWAADYPAHIRFAAVGE
jgi:hypothetical protein